MVWRLAGWNRRGAAAPPLAAGQEFSVKGAVAGFAWGVLFCQLAGGSTWSAWVLVAAFLALPAVSAFYTLAFTGCTPFTSCSGVKKEMRLALPAMGCAIALSGLLLLARKFL
jgi:acetyl-CoA decarbonylase/synthase complex subunit gamma